MITSQNLPIARALTRMDQIHRTVSRAGSAILFVSCLVAVLAILEFRLQTSGPCAAAVVKAVAPPTSPPNRILVWNQHNGPPANAGTTKIHVRLYGADGKAIWERQDVTLPWARTVDTFVSLPYEVPADVTLGRVRVEIAAFHGTAGGLAEIQVYRNGKNVSEGRPVKVSAICLPNDPRNGATLTDGNTSSQDELFGYWLLPAGAVGWAEVGLAR